MIVIMRRTFSVLLTASLLLGLTCLCSCDTESGGELPPINKPSGGGSSSGDEKPDEPDEPEVTSGKMLKADGKSDTYKLIDDAGYGNEAPDLYGVHTSQKHITQTFASDIKRYAFAFHIHIDGDNDRGKPNITDRQRNEIKTDDKSPDALLGFKGETVEYRWFFKLPAGMKTTSSFTHVHQIKGIDNKEGTADVSMPVVTFTVRSRSSAQQFEIKYTEPSEQGSDNHELAIANLADFLGEWVEVCETITYADKGSYSATITRCSDNKKLVEVKNEAIASWRTGTPAMRPKWGIYRHFGENGSNKPQLRDETLLFADFTIDKK